MLAQIVAALLVCAPSLSSRAGGVGAPVRAHATALPLARPRATACVVDGRAKASCFGSNATDATEILQAALSSNASYLLIDDIGRPWIVRPLFLSKVTDMVVELQPRVHILARQDFFHGNQDSLLQISQAKNLTINGNGALLQMRRDDYAQPPRGTCPTCRNYSKAEWRCGIWLQQSDGVTLRGLNVIESGGDGIFIRGGSLGRADPIPSLNTHVVDCVFDRNYRQGMSVISAINLTVHNTIFSNTAGTAPAAGVDLEPDHPHEGMANISFTDCSCVGNDGGGFQIYLANYNASTPPFSVRLQNMQISGGGGFGFGFGGLTEGVRGTVVVTDSTVQGTRSSAVMIFRHKGLSNSASFERCRFIDSCGSSPSCAPITLRMNPGVTSSIGNVSFVSASNLLPSLAAVQSAVSRNVFLG